MIPTVVGRRGISNYKMTLTLIMMIDFTAFYLSRQPVDWIILKMPKLDGGHH